MLLLVQVMNLSRPSTRGYTVGSAGLVDMVTPSRRQRPGVAAERLHSGRVAAGSVPRWRDCGQVHDHASAWALERQHCCRLVYDDEDGRPQTCPVPPTTVGWCQDGDGRWYPVAACKRHADQLEGRPRRP